MTEALDPEVKRLRKLSPGELADAVGQLKARISDLEEQLDACKAEAIRRELRQSEGKLFRLVLTPPGESPRLDRERLEEAFGAGFIAVFSRAVPHDWLMRCFARKAKGSAAPQSPPGGREA